MNSKLNFLRKKYDRQQVDQNKIIGMSTQPMLQKNMTVFMSNLWLSFRFS